MFGFKRKKEETLALVPRKKSIFSKIASFFTGNKEEKVEDYYSNQAFYSRHSYVTNSIDNSGEEVFYGTVSMNGLDIYSFQKIKELGLLHHQKGESTKLIVADLNQNYQTEGLEPQNLRKVCFEIPAYYSLEEFLYNDGLYQLVQSGRLNLEQLNYYKINPIGRAEMKSGNDMQTTVTILDNSIDALKYEEKVLTPEWLAQMKKEKKEQEKLRKQADKKMANDIYDQAFIDEENFKNRERQEKENRINDNNIRIAPGTNTMWFTDPDNGKIILLDRILKVNEVVHRDGQMSNLYVAKYTAKRRFDDVENLAHNNNIAFELSEDEMSNLLTNKNDSLNFAFRTLFSEANVDQYVGNGELGNRHIGYLKKTTEGYRILYGSESSRNYLNSLNMDLYNTQGKNSFVTFDDNEER